MGWLIWWGFLPGLVERFRFGVSAGLVFVPIHNAVNRRWAAHRRTTRAGKQPAR